MTRNESDVAALYMDSMSVAPGEPLVAHTAVRGRDRWYVDVYRIVGNQGTTFLPEVEWCRRFDVEPLRYSSGFDGPPTVGQADSHGCGWPGQTLLDEVPEEWRSGLYCARLTTDGTPPPTFPMVADDVRRAGGGPGGSVTLFVVRAGAAKNKILYQLGVATWNAYHLWNDQDLYVGDVGDIWGEDDYALRTPTVSFHRPGLGLSARSRTLVFPPIGFEYTVPFIEFLRLEGVEVDFCTGIDIHAGRVRLEDYDLLLTVGHDEYWSGPQRDAVEAYVNGGGRAAFFGGNLAFWQIRYADDLTSYVCYKRATHLSGGEPMDPEYRDPELYPDHDNSGVTVEFWTPPLNRPTIPLTGVEMRAFATDEDGNQVEGVGAAWWWENFEGPERPQKGFAVSDAEHWSLEGTGLAHGDVFGAEQKIVGFECDGLEVDWPEAGRPIPRDPAVAEHTTIVAWADCSDWNLDPDSFDEVPRGVQGRDIIASVGGMVTVVHARHGEGEVFTAPVTDWAHTLIDLEDYTEYRTEPRPVNRACRESQQITRNVLRRFGGADAASGIGGAR